MREGGAVDWSGSEIRTGTGPNGAGEVEGGNWAEGTSWRWEEPMLDWTDRGKRGYTRWATTATRYVVPHKPETSHWS